MKIVKQGYEIINEPDLFKKIELVARTCYKSEDKINDNSAYKIVNALVKSNHMAMLEHYSLIFKMDNYDYHKLLEMHYSNKVLKQQKYQYQRSNLLFSLNKLDKDNERYIVSGNLRAWHDMIKIFDFVYNDYPYVINQYLYKLTNGLLGIKRPDYDPLELYDIKLITPNDLIDNERLLHDTLTVKFIINRGLSHQLVRHRLCSFAQESTKYCNYSLDKFGKEITVIDPEEFNQYGSKFDKDKYYTWYHSCSKAEEAYMELLHLGVSPELARDVLPHSLKTELVITANLLEWRHIFKLRALNNTGPAHVQLQKIMNQLLDELINNKDYASAFDDLRQDQK